jgi:hypothetical protein
LNVNVVMTCIVNKILSLQWIVLIFLLTVGVYCRGVRNLWDIEVFIMIWYCGFLDYGIMSLAGRCLLVFFGEMCCPYFQSRDSTLSLYWEQTMCIVS